MGQAVIAVSGISTTCPIGTAIELLGAAKCISGHVKVVGRHNECVSSDTNDMWLSICGNMVPLVLSKQGKVHRSHTLHANACFIATLVAVLLRWCSFAWEEPSLCAMEVSVQFVPSMNTGSEGQQQRTSMCRHEQGPWQSTSPGPVRIHSCAHNVKGKHVWDCFPFTKHARAIPFSGCVGEKSMSLQGHDTQVCIWANAGMSEPSSHCMLVLLLTTPRCLHLRGCFGSWAHYPHHPHAE